MHALTSLLALGLLLFVSAIYRRRRHNLSLSKIPGPKPESFILGNLREVYQSEAAEADFKWQEEYGGIVRVKAAFGETSLLISDPKALQYIFHTSGYNFKKQLARRALTRLISGRGIIWADGDDHKRHRKILLPGFGAPEAKAFLPLFLDAAQQITTQWKEIIINSAEQSSVLNIPSFLYRATLDAIGEAAFDYKFGAIEEEDNALARAYNNLLADVFIFPSDTALFVQGILSCLPPWLLYYFMVYSPSPRLERARSTGKLATKIAKELVDAKTNALLQGSGKRDIMSILVKANATEVEKLRLEEEELLAQMRTIMLAGHETTSNTLSWLMLELAKHPDMQTKLREEIWAMEKVIAERGETEFSCKDLESMPYMNAVLKEVLRFHPVGYNSYRQASSDQVVPLSKPIVTTTGEILNEIFIPKGTKVTLSIAAYNRNRDLWGEDAHIFDPDRWFGLAAEKKGPTTGVYNNLLSFSGGVRSCIGWRFAVVELQTFLVEMIRNFEFKPTKEVENIRREACLVMVPTLKGQEKAGTQLPLMVSLASRD